MPNDVRQLYVMTNPTIPDMIKVGMTTVGAHSRAVGLSSSNALPASFQVYGYVDLPNITQGELRDLEQEAHRRLERYRFSEDREFFTVSPDQALAVLHEVKQDALQYKAQGLTVTGKPRQPTLPATPPRKTRSQLRAEARRLARLDEKARKHWHVWMEAGRNDNERVTSMVLNPRSYWSKSGAASRVKRETSHQKHAELILCRDSECPDYGKRRSETHT